MAYDTACSSSLVPLHGAVRALQHREYDIALVMVVSAPTVPVSIAFARMASQTG